MLDHPPAELRRQPPGPSRSPAAEPPTHRRISGAAPGGRGSVPASLPRSHRGAQRAPRLRWRRTVGLGTRRRLLPLLTRRTPERSSARMSVLPGLRPQLRLGCQRSADSPRPSSPVPVQEPPPRTGPSHAARVGALPVAPPTRVPRDPDPGSRKPPGRPRGGVQRSRRRLLRVSRTRWPGESSWGSRFSVIHSSYGFRIQP